MLEQEHRARQGVLSCLKLACCKQSEDLLVIAVDAETV